MQPISAQNLQGTAEGGACWLVGLEARNGTRKLGLPGSVTSRYLGRETRSAFGSLTWAWLPHSRLASVSKSALLKKLKAWSKVHDLRGRLQLLKRSEHAAWTPACCPLWTWTNHSPSTRSGFLVLWLLWYLNTSKAVVLTIWGYTFSQSSTTASHKPWEVSHSVLSLPSCDTAGSDWLHKPFQCTAQPWHSPTHSINICRASKR